MTVSGFSRHDLGREMGALGREMGAERSRQNGYGRPSGRIGGSEIRHRRESARRHAYSHCVGVYQRGSPAGRQPSFELGTEKEQVIF